MPKRRSRQQQPPLLLRMEDDSNEGEEGRVANRSGGDRQGAEEDKC